VPQQRAARSVAAAHIALKLSRDRIHTYPALRPPSAFSYSIFLFHYSIGHGGVQLAARRRQQILLDLHMIAASDRNLTIFQSCRSDWANA
jgi:hypothetical protein